MEARVLMGHTSPKAELLNFFGSCQFHHLDVTAAFVLLFFCYNLLSLLSSASKARWRGFILVLAEAAAFGSTGVLLWDTSCRLVTNMDLRILFLVASFVFVGPHQGRTYVMSLLSTPYAISSRLCCAASPVSQTANMRKGTCFFFFL